MAALLHLSSGSRATLQTVVSVWILYTGTVSDTEVLSSGIPQGSILSPAFFLLFISDLPLSWESRNGLFADDATFYASATTLSDVQLQLQRDLNSTATWTKEHGMVTHPEKTK